jgi:hypothetical protein
MAQRRRSTTGSSMPPRRLPPSLSWPTPETTHSWGNDLQGPLARRNRRIADLVKGLQDRELRRRTWSGNLLGLEDHDVH